MVECLFACYLPLLFAGVIVWKEYCGGFLIESVVVFRKEYYGGVMEGSLSNIVGAGVKDIGGFTQVVCGTADQVKSN